MEYKRLTDKRLALPKNTFRQSKSKEEYLELARIASKVDNAEIYNRLAELEDKIEQGTLIDTTKYFIVTEDYKPYQTRYLICKYGAHTDVYNFYTDKESAQRDLEMIYNV